MMAKAMQFVLLAIVCTVLLTEASLIDRVLSEVESKQPLGGWRQLNVTDAKVQAVAAEATAHLETLRNSGKVYRIQEVISAKYQIVRGTIYHLSLRIGETDCLREPNVDVEDCQILKVERCLVRVWVWQDTSDFINFTCRGEPNPGGETRIDVDSEEVEQAAVFAAAELTSRSNGRYQVQHRCISKATSQIVAGVMYRMTMVMAVISDDDSKAKTTRCRVAVVDRAWVTPRYTLEEYKCSRLIS